MVMSSAKERLKNIRGHLSAAHINERTGSEGSIPLKRQDILKWNGWGYSDTRFVFDDKVKKFRLTGKRYRLADKYLPRMREWIKTNFDVDPEKVRHFSQNIDECYVPEAIIDEKLLDDVKGTKISYSVDCHDRLFRAHGHALHEIFALREGKLKRIPDLVVWPKKHEDVVKLVGMAVEHKAVIIPFGGGTSVSGALECPENEKRLIISLDTSQMNTILWIDHENLTAKVEAGIIGQDLERKLANHGVCTGHEPDSFEFSSLGGWVATKASGMKKNIYGNIEDIVVHVRLVTPMGVIERSCMVPRLSSGPDVQNFIFGSEGTLGVVTEIIIKVRPIPEEKRYGSILFKSFEDGFKFMREVARQQLKPASIRLMDNQQFVLGQALKPESDSTWEFIGDIFKRIYITKFKGFDPKNMCVVTLLLEGTKEEVHLLERKILDLGVQHGGFSAGAENGRKGYMMTFVIAYIRDAALDFGIIAESFETSVPWNRALNLCRNVKDLILNEAKKHGVAKTMVSFRLTQTYDAGACIYFYLGLYCGQSNDQMSMFHEIEASAREEIIACGGSVSHHHGIGKLRKRWLADSISEMGVGMMKAVKNYIDPENVFGNGNLML